MTKRAPILNQMSSSTKESNLKKTSEDPLLEELVQNLESSQATAKKTIDLIVVNKNDFEIHQIKSIIAGTQFQVVASFYDANSASQYLRQNAHDINIAIIDLLMPDQSGLVMYSMWKKKYPSLHYLFTCSLPYFHHAIKLPFNRHFRYLRTPIYASNLMNALAALRENSRSIVNKKKMMGAA